MTEPVGFVDRTLELRVRDGWRSRRIATFTAEIPVDLEPNMDGDHLSLTPRTTEGIAQALRELADAFDALEIAEDCS